VCSMLIFNVGGVDGHGPRKILETLKFGGGGGDIHVVCLPSLTKHRLRSQGRCFLNPLLHGNE